MLNSHLWRKRKTRGDIVHQGISLKASDKTAVDEDTLRQSVDSVTIDAEFNKKRKREKTPEVSVLLFTDRVDLSLTGPCSNCTKLFLLQVINQQLALAVVLTLVPVGMTRHPEHAAWHNLQQLMALPSALDNDVCGADERCQGCNVQLKLCAWQASSSMCSRMVHSAIADQPAAAGYRLSWFG